MDVRVDEAGSDKSSWQRRGIPHLGTRDPAALDPDLALLAVRERRPGESPPLAHVATMPQRVGPRVDRLREADTARSCGFEWLDELGHALYDDGWRGGVEARRARHLAGRA